MRTRRTPAATKFGPCADCAHKMENHFPKAYGTRSGEMLACFGRRRGNRAEPNGSCKCAAYRSPESVTITPHVVTHA